MPPDGETVIYKQVGDLAIRADISLPAGRGPHPVIVFIHGGALIMGSRKWIDPTQRESYLSDGFAVVSIDYRLAPETKLAAIVSDLDDAVAWVRGDGGRRLGVLFKKPAVKSGTRLVTETGRGKERQQRPLWSARSKWKASSVGAFKNNVKISCKLVSEHIKRHRIRHVRQNLRFNEQGEPVIGVYDEAINEGRSFECSQPCSLSSVHDMWNEVA